MRYGRSPIIKIQIGAVRYNPSSPRGRHAMLIVDA